MYQMESKAPQEFSRSTCRKTIWEIYRLAPSIAWFSLQILSESSGDVLEVLEFSKLKDEERQNGERSLYQLIGKIYPKYHLDEYASFAKIACEFLYGFGCDYKIKIYIRD